MTIISLDPSDSLPLTLYMGEYFTNIRDSRNKVNRPPEEWVKTTVSPIIDSATFERVREMRELHSPSQDTSPSGE